MAGRYVVHPMEQKFRDDMVAQAKRNAFMKEVYEECGEMEITEPSRIFKRAFHMGEYYAKQEARFALPKATRTYEEWLDTKVGELNGAAVTMRHYIGPDQHAVAKMVYDSLMKELVK